MSRSKDRDSKILWFIHNYQSTHGYPPNIREMQKALGYKSVTAIQEGLDRLYEAGIITGNRRTDRWVQFHQMNTLEFGRIPIIGEVD